MSHERSSSYHHRFPSACKKALVMSYDDGSEHDRRLVNLFNDYGIRGTFHLNSSTIGNDYIVTRDEISTLYHYHEISSHTAHHADLTQLADHDVRAEIASDLKALECLAGYPIRGLAYPFGRYDNRVAGLVSDLGLAYARTIDDTHDFRQPGDALKLSTTCHHNIAMDVGERFLAGSETSLGLMTVWGHSFELDGFMSADSSKNWAYMEAFCRRMQSDPSIWFATLIEVVDYLNALRLVDASSTDMKISNPTNLSVWVHVHDEDIEIPPGDDVDLASSST